MTISFYKSTNATELSTIQVSPQEADFLEKRIKRNGAKEVQDDIHIVDRHIVINNRHYEFDENKKYILEEIKTQLINRINNPAQMNPALYYKIFSNNHSQTIPSPNPLTADASAQEKLEKESDLIKKGNAKLYHNYVICNPFTLPAMPAFEYFYSNIRKRIERLTQENDTTPFNQMLKIRKTNAAIDDLYAKLLKNLRTADVKTEKEDHFLNKQINNIKKYYLKVRRELNEILGQVRKDVYFGSNNQYSRSLTHLLASLLNVKHHDSYATVEDILKESLNPCHWIQTHLDFNSFINPYREKSQFENTITQLFKIINEKRLNYKDKLTKVNFIVSENKPSNIKFWLKNKNDSYNEIALKASLFCLIEGFIKAQLSDPCFIVELEKLIAKENDQKNTPLKQFKEKLMTIYESHASLSNSSNPYPFSHKMLLKKYLKQTLKYEKNDLNEKTFLSTKLYAERHYKELNNEKRAFKQGLFNPKKQTTVNNSVDIEIELVRRLKY